MVTSVLCVNTSRFRPIYWMGIDTLQDEEEEKEGAKKRVAANERVEAGGWMVMVVRQKQWMRLSCFCLLPLAHASS